jgi:hypothetical protein
MNNSILSSINITNNLPAYIRDDENYSKFINFLESYYNWFNDSYSLRDFDKNIDIDDTLDSFVQYFSADFLPNFPTILPNELKQNRVLLLKLAKEFFMAKGTPDSFKFLFRALFKSEVDLVLTQEFVLTASGGTWIAPKSIKIKSLDSIFLNIVNYKIFGTLSKTFGTIENSGISGKYTKIYVSDIKRSFIAGEEITILDNRNLPVYQLNGTIISYDTTPPIGATKLTSNIIGALSSITIDPIYRGQLANIGDPVIIYTGLVGTNPIGATAQVSKISAGGISNVHVISGGVGYFPDASVKFSSAGNNIPSATASLLVDYNNSISTNNIITTLITNDIANLTIGMAMYPFQNTAFGFANNANANVVLSSTLQTTSIVTYPIQNIIINTPGSGFTSNPIATVTSYINVNTSNVTTNTISYQPIPLDSFGILGPLQILNSGSGYNLSDVINITGGSGYGAFAKITALVPITNGIANVAFYQKTGYILPEGGVGYTINSGLPNISVTSGTGSNAQLTVTQILSSGLQTAIDTKAVGEITEISLINAGESYETTPLVSVRVLDIVSSNITIPYLLNSGYSYIYQGADFQTSTFSSRISSVTLLDSKTANTILDDVYLLRTFNYTGTANLSAPFIVYHDGDHDIDNDNDIDDITIGEYANTTFKIETSYYTNGFKFYGSGTARATAQFSTATESDPGFYLSNKSLLSENSVLQNEIYNTQTYIVSVDQSVDSYKNSMKSLVHPIGTQAIFRSLIKSEYISNTDISVITTSSYGKASLNVDFSISNTINVIDSKILCNRNSIGTYTDRFGIIKYATANTLRIDYNTSICKGLLIEESRTNILKFSTNFSNTANWSTNDCTLNTNILSPDGTYNAFKLLAGNTTTTHTITQLHTSNRYYKSVYAKAAEKLYIQISGATSEFANYDLNSGKITANTGGIASIANVGNGWYRCGFYGNSATTNNKFQIIDSNTAIYNATSTGNSNIGLYIWGPQAELGSFITTYIPTTDTTVTRNADIITITDFTNWYNVAGGSIIVTGEIFNQNTVNKIVTISDNSNSNFINITTANTGKVSFNVVSSSVIQATGNSVLSIANNTNFTFGLSISTNSFMGSLNQATPIIDTLGVMPVTTILNIGSDYTNSSNVLNGHIKQISYYPRALSSSELQTISS